MGWFSNFMQQVAAGASTQKPVINDTELTFPITMLGARGIGKTTMIAALWEQFGTLKSNFGLQMIPEEQTQIGLEDRLLELKTLALTADGQRCDFSRSIKGSAGHIAYGMELYLASTHSRLNLIFNDYPGGWLRDPDLQVRRKVTEMLAESQIIFVTVDAPALMTLKDDQHELMNRAKTISVNLQRGLAEGRDLQRLVVFCIMRGEKWLQTGQGDTLLETLEQRFSDSFSTLNAYRNSVATVVCPIQTLGCVQFDTWEPMVGGALGEPNVKPIFVKHGSGGYTPIDCDQPLRYLLSFLSNQLSAAVQQHQREADLRVGGAGTVTKTVRGLFNMFGAKSTDQQALEEWTRRSTALRGAMEQFGRGCKQTPPFRIVNDPSLLDVKA